MTIEHGETTTGRTTTGTAGISRSGGTVTRRTGGRVGVLDSTVTASRRTARDVAGALGRGLRWAASTVTPLGWFLIAVLVAAVAAGVALGWAEGWAIAVVAAVILLVCAPFLIGSIAFDVTLQVDETRVVAGTDVGARLVVVNRGRTVSLPAVVDVPVGSGLVEAHVPLLAAGATHVQDVAIGARRRGVVQVGPSTIARGDPIGVLRREVAWPQVEQIFIHPVTVPLPATSSGFLKDVDGSPTRTIVDSDLAFHAIREYLPGDSRRHVHWKATAKTGQLMVRQFEESRRSRVGVLLDLRLDGYADEDEFELAVSAAASVGVQGIRDGREVLFATGGETVDRAGWRAATLKTLPTRTPTSLLDATSRIEHAATGLPLEDVVALMGQTFPDLSMLVVATGSRVPPERIRRTAFRMPVGVVPVIVRAEALAEPKGRQLGGATVLSIGLIGDLGHLLARGAL